MMNLTNILQTDKNTERIQGTKRPSALFHLCASIWRVSVIKERRRDQYRFMITDSPVHGRELKGEKSSGDKSQQILLCVGLICASLLCLISWSCLLEASGSNINRKRTNCNNTLWWERELENIQFYSFNPYFMNIITFPHKSISVLHAATSENFSSGSFFVVSFKK